MSEPISEYMTFEEKRVKSLIKGRVLETLEFPKIRDELVSMSRTPYGMEICMDLCPSNDEDYVRAHISLNSTCPRFRAGPTSGPDFPMLLQAEPYPWQSSLMLLPFSSASKL